MGKDSAARIELGRSSHQMGTDNEKVCERDFLPLWDGTIIRIFIFNVYINITSVKCDIKLLYKI